MSARTTTDGYIGTAAPEGAPALPPRISWGAVFAGAVVAVTIGAMLNLLGLAVGFTTIDPAQPGETPAASTLGIAAGAWLLAANLIGLAVGGWTAARLSGTADGTDGTLHGLSVWAVGFLLASLLLGNAVAGVTGTAVRGASSLLGGAAQGIGQAAQAVAPAAADAARGVDPQALTNRLQDALAGGGDPATMSSDQRKAEMAQLLGRRVTGNEIDRERLSQLVAAEYGIPAEQAQQRVQQVEAQATQLANEAAARARQAAETASDAAATSAYWIFAAMLLGAVAAVLGARVGTRRAVAVRAVA
jgi:hypothetical protein